MWAQAERDEKKMADVEKQAVLAAQAVALRRKLTESHLAKFRTEAKNRCDADHGTSTAESNLEKGGSRNISTMRAPEQGRRYFADKA